MIEEHIRLGHAVKADPTQLIETSKRDWYLPHHAVINPNIPGKLRVVFDAKHQGVVLKEKFLKGPDLLTSLLGLLLRLREHQIAVSGEIEKMFDQVRVIPADLSSLRFVWRIPDSDLPPEDFEITVQVFGAVSSPTACTFVLRRTVEDRRNEFEDIARKIADNFYGNHSRQNKKSFGPAND